MVKNNSPFFETNLRRTSTTSTVSSSGTLVSPVFPPTISSSLPLQFSLSPEEFKDTDFEKRLKSDPTLAVKNEVNEDEDEDQDQDNDDMFEDALDFFPSEHSLSAPTRRSSISAHTILMHTLASKNSITETADEVWQQRLLVERERADGWERAAHEAFATIELLEEVLVKGLENVEISEMTDERVLNLIEWKKAIENSSFK
jgi:hypothetical protein